MTAPTIPPLADLVAHAWARRLIAGLTAAGHDPVWASVASLSHPELSALPGVGAGTQKAIQGILRTHGLKLAPTPEHRQRVAVIECWHEAGADKTIRGDRFGRIAAEVGAALELDPNDTAARSRLVAAMRRYLRDLPFPGEPTLRAFAYDLEARFSTPRPKPEEAPRLSLAERHRQMKEAQAKSGRPSLHLIGGGR